MDGAPARVRFHLRGFNLAFIIDGHEDLATNMITFGRDYRRSAAETRAREDGTSTPGLNGDTLLGWEDYQRGKVALIFATLFSSPEKYRLDGWDITTFSNPAEAHSVCLRQLDAYKKLAENDPEKYSLVMSSRDLESVLEPWLDEPSAFPHTTHPVGLMILMEGAEGLKEPEEVEEWWHAGVRMIGPVWSGTRWCGGTREPGRFTPEGFQLLDHMANTGFILDISHMSPESALQALDYYPGRIAASHANAISLIHGSTSPVFQNRHLTDETIRLLVGRNGVIGVLPMIPMLVANWKSGDPRSAATLETVFTQIDHICQLAGDTLHVALGTDFDGGFGLQSSLEDLDTIADLQKLDPILRKNGYSGSDIAAILGNNWKRFLEESLP
jgi:membrane dipeptidase